MICERGDNFFGAEKFFMPYSDVAIECTSLWRFSSDFLKYYFVQLEQWLTSLGTAKRMVMI